MIICLGPICIPIWTLLPFLVAFFAKIKTWLGYATPPKEGDSTISGPFATEIEQKVTELKKIGETDNSDSELRQRSIKTPVQAVKTREDFISVLARSIVEEKKVFVKYTAGWCGPCKKISPVFSELSEASTQPFIEIDIDLLKDVATDAGAIAVPMFQIFENGSPIETWSGATEDKLREMVAKHS